MIAHSMGTRVLTTALKDLAASAAAAPVQYDQIVLAAPDIDAAVFKRQIAPRIATAAERISIYSSSNDWALVASKKAHRYKRLGEGGENLTTFGTPGAEGLKGAGQSDTGVYQIHLEAEGHYSDMRTEMPHWDGRHHYLLRDLWL